MPHTRNAAQAPIASNVTAGVDCHKQTHTICFVDSVGKLLHTLTVECSDEGYEAAIEAAQKYKVSRWGLESTGSYGLHFAAKLHELGFVVYEVPGSATTRERKHASRHGKSDQNDAHAIAKVVLAENERLARFAPSEQREALRLMYDLRDRLVVQRSVAKNRLHSLVLRLQLKSTPTDFRSNRALTQIRQAAQILDRSAKVVGVLLNDLEWTIAEIEMANAKIRELDSEMASIVEQLTPELLQIRGVSSTVAAGIVGHSGDVRNCRNASAFAMRCGTAPIPCSSGRNATVRLSLGGNRQLNRLLHVIALVQVRTAGHAGREYYDRKRSEGKTHKAAFRALKRQLSTIVFYRLAPCSVRINEGIRAAAA